jgi:hypothetical protein
MVSAFGNRWSNRMARLCYAPIGNGSYGKETAKVRKRIGICKKIGKFLANPNKIVDDLLLKQASYTHD